MDVDNELDTQLLQQFSSMGTTDKEVLVAEFQKLVGDQLNLGGCAFFLDMANWNLQAAICAYYDYGDQPSIKLPQLKFIRDVTVGEGESVPPNTKFTKTWHILNSGDEPWPPGCQLKFCMGENLALTDRVIVGTLPPGEGCDVSVTMESGSEPGVFQSQWRMCTATGMYFGEVIWVIVTVADGGVLAVTQQLSKFGTDFAQTQPKQNAPNPFGSPQNDGECSGRIAGLLSPSGSLVAQQGSPYTSQLSPSPPHHNAHQPQANPSLARPLFPMNGSVENSSNCDDSNMIDEDMS